MSIDTRWTLSRRATPLTWRGAEPVVNFVSLYAVIKQCSEQARTMSQNTRRPAWWHRGRYDGVLTEATQPFLRRVIVSGQR
jgi:hypothetical protein